MVDPMSLMTQPGEVPSYLARLMSMGSILASVPVPCGALQGQGGNDQKKTESGPWHPSRWN